MLKNGMPPRVADNRLTVSSYSKQNHPGPVSTSDLKHGKDNGCEHLSELKAVSRLEGFRETGH